MRTKIVIELSEAEIIKALIEKARDSSCDTLGDFDGVVKVFDGTSLLDFTKAEVWFTQKEWSTTSRDAV